MSAQYQFHLGVLRLAAYAERGWVREARLRRELEQEVQRLTAHIDFLDQAGRKAQVRCGAVRCGSGSGSGTNRDDAAAMAAAAAWALMSCHGWDAPAWSYVCGRSALPRSKTKRWFLWWYVHTEVGGW